MALFNFNKNKIHYVQSYENPEYNGIRIYFNGNNEKKSNLNMLGYIGEEEYKKIKSDPIKYKYIREEMTENQLKSMGINPNTTGHLIYNGPNDIKNEMKKFINIENEIKKIKIEDKNLLKTGPSVFEDKNNLDHDIKIETKKNEKEININVTDDHGNKSKAKGLISQSGKEIHIHINLGSSPHLEKAMIENQNAIKKLQQEFSQSLQDAKDTIKKMEDKLKEKSIQDKSFSSNFYELTNTKPLSKPEILFNKLDQEAEKKIIDNVIDINREKKENNIDKPKLNEEINKNIIKSNLAENVQTQNLSNKEDKIITPDLDVQKEEKELIRPITFNDAINLANKESTLFFRGRYQKKDTIEGLSFDHVNNTAKQILKDKYDKKIYSIENKGDYSIIKNILANKIQNYVIEKENISKIISNSDAPTELKSILEKYNKKELDNQKLANKKNLVENDKQIEL